MSNSLKQKLFETLKSKNKTLNATNHHANSYYFYNYEIDYDLNDDDGNKNYDTSFNNINNTYEYSLIENNTVNNVNSTSLVSSDDVFQITKMSMPILYIVIVLVIYLVLLFFIFVCALYEHRRRVGYNYDELDEEYDEYEDKSNESQRSANHDNLNEEYSFNIDECTCRHKHKDKKQFKDVINSQPKNNDKIIRDEYVDNDESVCDEEEYLFRELENKIEHDSDDERDNFKFKKPIELKDMRKKIESEIENEHDKDNNNNRHENDVNSNDNCNSSDYDNDDKGFNNKSDISFPLLKTFKNFFIKKETKIKKKCKTEIELLSESNINEECKQKSIYRKKKLFNCKNTSLVEPLLLNNQDHSQTYAEMDL